MKKAEVLIDFVEGDGADREEFKGTVVMRKLKFGERLDVREEASEPLYSAKGGDARVSSRKAVYLSLTKSIVSSSLKKIRFEEDSVTKELRAVESPLELTMQTLPSLPEEVGQQLCEVFEELNSLVNDKKKDS